MNRAAPTHGHVFAIIPVGTLEGAKSRLGETLDAEERRDLATRMAHRTIEAAVATPGIDEVLVVTPDQAVRDLALAAGARPLRQRSQGLNRGLREAREEALAAGADAIVVLPIDLPLISPEALGRVLERLSDPERPLVVLVSDRHRRGTNVPCGVRGRGRRPPGGARRPAHARPGHARRPAAHRTAGPREGACRLSSG